MINPNLITPESKPLSISSIAYAPRMVLNPLFSSPTTLYKFRLDLMTAFQNGAIMYDQSSRLIFTAPSFSRSFV